MAVPPPLPTQLRE
jgi:hypothetical protein